MKILYDSQAFDMQKYGGVSRYFYEVYKGASLQMDAEICALQTSNLLLMNEPQFSRDSIPQLSPKRSLFRRVLGKLSPSESPTISNRDTNRQYAIKRLEARDWSLFHPTFFHPYFLDFMNSRPFVITVYDMIQEKYPEFFIESSNFFRSKKAICERAAHIIAISNQTKSDLMDFYAIDEDRISVVYLASSMDQTSRSIDQYSEQHVPEAFDYILYTGTRTTYKNFPFFIEAISPLLHRNPRLRVVCTGPRFSQTERAFFDYLGVEDRMQHKFCNTDEELARLYRNALVFVFPSLYEGFGIPVLEAFACHCPVLASRTPALREIAADAAFYFDPKSLKEMREATERLIGSATLRRELVQAGHNRQRDFSWGKTVQQTLSVYRNVIGIS